MWNNHRAIATASPASSPSTVSAVVMNVHRAAHLASRRLATLQVRVPESSGSSPPWSLWKVIDPLDKRICIKDRVTCLLPGNRQIDFIVRSTTKALKGVELALKE